MLHARCRIMGKGTYRCTLKDSDGDIIFYLFDERRGKDHFDRKRCEQDGSRHHLIVFSQSEDRMTIDARIGSHNYHRAIDAGHGTEHGVELLHDALRHPSDLWGWHSFLERRDVIALLASHCEKGISALQGTLNTDDATRYVLQLLLLDHLVHRGHLCGRGPFQAVPGRSSHDAVPWSEQVARLIGLMAYPPHEAEAEMVPPLGPSILLGGAAPSTNIPDPFFYSAGDWSFFPLPVSRGELDVHVIAHVAEAILDQESRKTCGCFFTPQPLVTHMCWRTIVPCVVSMANGASATSYHGADEGLRSGDPAWLDAFTHALRNVRIVDPSCGNGHFLVEALSTLVRLHEALVDVHPQAAKDIDAPWHFIEHCICGVDISAMLVDMTRLRLRMKALCSTGELRDVGDRCHVGNGLLGTIRQDEDGRTSPSHTTYAGDGSVQGSMPHEWTKWHADVFSKRGGFDVVIGNPPYGKVKNLDLPRTEKRAISHIYRERFPTLKGNIEYSRLFLALSIELLREGGHCSLVVPSMVWGDSDTHELRTHYVRHVLSEVYHFPYETTRTIFGGAVLFEVSVFVGRLCSNNMDGTITFFPSISVPEIFSMRSIMGIDTTINNILSSSHLARLPLPVGGQGGHDILSYMSSFPRLSEMNMEIFVGKVDETLDREHLSAVPTEELLIAANHIKDWHVELDGLGSKRWVIRGEDVRARRLRHPIAGATTVGELMDGSPKIVGRQMAHRGEKKKLHFSLHYGHELLTNGVRVIVLPDASRDDYAFLLAVLNSCVANWVFSAYSLTFNVKPYELQDLPLPLPESYERTVIRTLVEHVLLAYELECDKKMRDFFVLLLDVVMTELFCLRRFVSDATYANYGSTIIPLVANHLDQLPFATIMERSRSYGAIRSMTRSKLVETHAAMYDDMELRNAVLRVLAHPWAKMFFQHHDRRARPFP